MTLAILFKKFTKTRLKLVMHFNIGCLSTATSADALRDSDILQLMFNKLQSGRSLKHDLFLTETLSFTILLKLFGVSANNSLVFLFS